MKQQQSLINGIKTFFAIVLFFCISSAADSTTSVSTKHTAAASDTKNAGIVSPNVSDSAKSTINPSLEKSTVIAPDSAKQLSHADKSKTTVATDDTSKQTHGSSAQVELTNATNPANQANQSNVNASLKISIDTTNKSASTKAIVPSAVTSISDSISKQPTVGTNQTPQQVAFPSDSVRKLSDIQINAQRKSADVIMEPGTEISRVDLNPENIRTLSTSGEADISRTLQLFPGISAANENSSGLFIRGSTPDHNLIIFDDFIIPHAEHLFGYTSIFNSNSVTSVSLYKGGFPVKYGGRTSGVVELKGKEGNKDLFSAGGEVGLISTNGFVNIPLFSKGAIHISARSSYSDIIQSNLFSTLVNTLNPNTNNTLYTELKKGFPNLRHEAPFNFYDAHSTLYFDVTDKNRLKYSYFRSRDIFSDSYQGDSLKKIIKPGPKPDTFPARSFTLAENNNVWNNFGNGINWENTSSKNWNFKIGMGYSDFSDKDQYHTRLWRTTPTSDSILTFRNNYKSNSLKTLNSRFDNELFNSSKHHQLNIGTEAIATITTYAVNDTQPSANKNQYLKDTAVQIAGYIKEKINLFEILQFSPGLRLTRYTGTHQYYFEPRIQSSIALSKNLSFSAAWGKYNQYINKILHEDIFSGNNYFWFNADNKHCNVIKAQHIIGSFSFSSPDFYAGVEAYRIDRRDITHYTASKKPQDLLDIPLFYSGNSLTHGIELLLQKKIGIYSGWVSYTYNKTMDHFKELYNGEHFPNWQDRTNSVTIVNSLALGSFDVSATWIYATGLPYTKILGKYIIANPNTDNSSNLFYHVATGYRLQDYHRLDINVMYSLSASNRFKSQIGFALFNVYNRINEWSHSYAQIPYAYDSREFGPPPGGKKIMTERVGTTNGLTPSFFVRVLF